MKRFGFRTDLSGLLIGGLLLACGPAWGGPIAFAPPSGPQCTTLPTIAAWIATPDCFLGDKNYHFVGETGLTGTAAPANDLLGVSQITLGNGDIQHTLLLSFNAPTGVVAGFLATISYTVAINSSEVNIAGIDQVRFDTTTGVNPGETATSFITPSVGPALTLHSNDGVSSPATALPSEPQSLAYLDSFSVTGAGSLLTAADTLVETNNANVPEPASLALVGLGLSALGFMRRRKER